MLLASVIPRSHAHLSFVPFLLYSRRLCPFCHCWVCVYVCVWGGGGLSFSILFSYFCIFLLHFGLLQSWPCLVYCLGPCFFHILVVWLIVWFFWWWLGLGLVAFPLFCLLSSLFVVSALSSVRILVSETWLHDYIKNDEIRIPGCNVFREDRTTRLVNSSHKWPVTRKMFPFDGVIMKWKLIFWTILLWANQMISVEFQWPPLDEH